MRPFPAMTEPLATHEFETGKVAEALEFLKRTRFELRPLRKVHVFDDKLRVFDVNHDYFEIRGVGYPDAEIVPILKNVNTNFKPETIHDPTDSQFKEFLTGRRYPWARDRVM